MKPFSEIKNLTELMLTSVHVKLLTDCKGRIQTAYALEKESCRFHPVQSLSGKSVVDCINVDQIKKIVNGMALVCEQQQPVLIPIKFSSKGVLVQLDCDISAISDQNLLITFIHKHSQSEINIPPVPVPELNKQFEIHQLNQAIRTLVDQVQELCIIVAPSGELIYSNQAFHDMMGYSKDDLNQLHFIDLLPTDQKEMFTRFLNNPSEVSFQRETLSLITKAGEALDFDTKFMVQRNDGRKLLIIRMIQKNQPLPAGVDETIREQIIKVTSKLSLPMLMIDERSLKIMFANASAHKYYEFDENELIDQNLLSLFPESENQNLISLLREERTFSQEFEYSWSQLTKKGLEKKSRFFVNHLTLEDQKIMLILVREPFQETNTHLIREESDAYQHSDQDLLKVHLTPSGMVTYANQAFCELLGISMQKIIGRSFEENLFLEDYEDIFQHFSKLTPQNPVRKNRNRVLDINGNILWTEWTDRAIFEGDQLSEIQSVGKDITASYQTELLRSSMEQRYQALVENLPMVIYVIHAETFFPFYISPQVEKLTGYTPEEFYRNPQVWIDAMHPDDAHKFYGMLQERIEKKVSAPVEFRMIHKDGHMVWAEEIGSTIELADGTVLFQGASRDVTERHYAREKLLFYSHFEGLINEISLKLLKTNAQNFPESLEFIVHELGKILQVDRAYIFDFNKTKKTMTNTFEWCHSGVTPMIAKLQNVNISNFRWWMERINNLQEIVIESLSDLPEAAANERENLFDQDIKSLLVVPLIQAGEASGFIGFDMVREETHWEQESINLLRLVSAMIGSTLERMKDEPKFSH